MPLIVVEGIDGSGKSTLCSALQSRCNGPAAIFRGPDPATAVGNYIRKCLSNEVPYCESELMCLMLADRASTNRSIEEFLRSTQGKGLAICDRYFPSTLAYQRGVLDDQTLWYLNMAAGIVIPPDLIVYIDVNVDTAMRRLASKKHLEVKENRETLQKVRANYLHWLHKLRQVFSGRVVTMVSDTMSTEEMVERLADSTLLAERLSR